jgi:hypothetical protein
VFPPSTLAGVYVKGSLKNTEDGFEFALRNNIESTMLSGIGPVVVDEQTYSGAALTVAGGGRVWQGDQVSWSNPVPASVGTTMQVRVQGQPLPAGPVRIAVTATSTDIGRVTLEVADTV